MPNKNADKRRLATTFMATVVGVLLFLPQLAMADEPGTYFFAEADGGVSTSLGAETAGLGYAFGARSAAGGRIPGTFFRAYGMIGIDVESFDLSRPAPTGGVEKLGRSLFGADAGFRIMAQLIPEIRIYGDLLGELLWLQSEERLKNGDLVIFEDQTPRFAGAVALGAQLRPMTWLSIGGRVRWTFILDDADLPPDEITGAASISATFTLHY